MKLQAPAKINLGLKVLQKRRDGYHEIETIMQRIGLKDYLLLTKRPDAEIRIICRGEDIPERENLVYKAAELLQKRCHYRSGVEIVLYKNIPPGAGLGGGSSDAAATLWGLNHLWKLDLGVEELMRIAVRLGADVPFFLHDGAAFAKGIGEKLKPFPRIPFTPVVLAKPPHLAVSTGKIYSTYSDLKLPPSGIDFSFLTERLAIPSRNILVSWFKQRHLNDLEPAALKLYPEIGKLKKFFRKIGLNPAMTGSGPTVYSLAGSLKAAFQAASYLEREGYQAWASWTE